MALYVLAFDRIIYTNMGFSVRGQSMTSTRAPLMTSLPPARTKFPMDTMTSGYVIVMWAAQGNKNPGISRYSVWNSFNFAVIMYASNLFRTVAPVLRRTTANPQGTSSCLLFRITSPRPPSSLPSPPLFFPSHSRQYQAAHRSQYGSHCHRPRRRGWCILDIWHQEGAGW